MEGVNSTKQLESIIYPAMLWAILGPSLEFRVLAHLIHARARAKIRWTTTLNNIRIDDPGIVHDPTELFGALLDVGMDRDRGSGRVERA